MIFADAGYTGTEEREALKGREVTWHIATKRGKIAALPDGQWKDLRKQIERLKSPVRRRVEQVFHVIKDRCHPRQWRYPGLKKHGARHHIRFALAHLVIAQKALLAAGGRLAPNYWAAGPIWPPEGPT